MPNWNDVLKEIQACKSPLDSVRQKYLNQLNEKTGRNVIAYYSGWLQKPNIQGIEITDADKNGFMNAIHGLDRSKGLDLILHTPGGETGATESLVDYLRHMFSTDIRAIVPQIAMSAGSMIACSCKSIVMGKHSNLGPIDPQFGGIPALGVVEEYKRAIEEVKKDPGSTPIWATIIGKYHPTFIGQCEKAISWSEEITVDWLKTCMFKDDENGEELAKKIVERMTDPELTKNHSRHISLNDCIEMGLKIEQLEDMNDNLQDAILTIHHTFMHTLANSPVFKIIENHDGKALLNTIST